MVALHQVVEAGLVELAVHLRIHAGEDDVDALFVVHLDECLQIVYAGGVDEGHLAHADDADTGFLASDVRHQVVELVGNAEEVRAVDLVDGTALGNRQVLLVRCPVRSVAQVYLVLDDRDFGRLHDAFHKEGTGQDEADLDGNGEVEDDGQQEGHGHHEDVALRILQQAADGAPAAHVVADDDQYGSQRSHRDIFGIGHEQQQDGEQHDGMDETRHGRTAAVVDVRHGACDGACGRDASEEWRHHVCHALGDELHVRVVLVADYAVGHRCGEQALDGAEDGYGEGHRHELLDELEGDARHDHLRQLGLNVEAVADGVDALDALLLQQEHSHGTKQDAPQRTGYLAEARHLLQRLGREDDDQQGTDGDDEVPEVERADVLGIANPFAHEVARRLQGNADDFARGAHGRLRQPEDVADLRREDGQGDTCREADNDGVGNELDDDAQAESAQRDEYQASQNRGDEQALQAILRVVHDAIDDDDEGTRRAANLHLCAAEQRDEEACHDGRNDALLGRHAAGNAEGDGKGQGHNAHDDARHEVLQERLAAVIL